MRSGTLADEDVVRVEEDDGIFTLTFNRPEKRNAMNPALHRRMHQLLSELRYNQKVRVLIVTGAGDSFCAGQDLKEYFLEQEGLDSRMAREKAIAMATEWRSHLLRLFPAPTIAAVNGWCFGGAFSVVASCDIAIAADEAMFGLSEINWKTFPGGLVSRHFTELSPQRQVMYYALTGKPFSGKKAAEIGFVTQSVPREQLMAEVRSLAEELRDKDQYALRTTKEQIKLGIDMNYEEAFGYSAAKAVELRWRQGAETQHGGITDFLDGKYRPGLGSLKT
jgi:trans-feruloyl-CoA hydratase/vanillin synthase